METICRTTDNALEGAYEKAVEVVRAAAALEQDLTERMDKSGSVGPFKQYWAQDGFGLRWRYSARRDDCTVERLRQAARPLDQNDPLLPCVVSLYPRQALARHLIARFRWEPHDVEALKAIHRMNTKNVLVLPTSGSAKQWATVLGTAGLIYETSKEWIAGWPADLSSSLGEILLQSVLAAATGFMLAIIVYHLKCSKDRELLARVEETLEYAEILIGHSAAAR